MEELENTELIDECWGMIFNRLNSASDRESITLVCKKFLSITNSLRDKIKFLDTIPITILSRLLQRFPNLKKIKFDKYGGDLNEAVVAIAQSGLDLEELQDMTYDRNQRAEWFEELGSNMKNLKVLRYSGGYGDADLVRIADSLPQIEELHIFHRYVYNEDVEEGNRLVVTDAGIDYLSSKLKRLRKIDLVQESCISDKSLISLSKNCALLEHIEVISCSVTLKGIAYLIKNSHNLNSFYLCKHFKIDGLFDISDGNFLPNLRSLKLVRVHISDAFFISIIEAQILLTDLALNHCKGYTFTGLSRLLHHSFQSLKSLELLSVEFLTNEHIENLSCFLQNLTSIKLNDCYHLSDSAFAMITQRCTRLSSIEMTETSLGREEYNYDGLMKNCAIKYLNLSSSGRLSPNVLKCILNICPEVEKLTLCQCFSVPHDQLNVPNILKCNKSLLKLVLTGSHLLNDYGEDLESEFSLLEKLNLSFSDINDELLTKLARICPRLTYLDLDTCKNVTEAGIKEVVKLCKRMRYLSLCCCKNVDINVIAWIVTNSSSLTKIVSSSHKYPDDENQKLFLQQGCLVLRDPHEPNE